MDNLELKNAVPYKSVDASDEKQVMDRKDKQFI